VRGILRHVEHIVHNLEGEARLAAKDGQALHVFGRGPGIHAAGDDADTNERAGLGAMNGIDRLRRGPGSLALEIEHLAANHTFDGAGGLGDEANDLHRRGRGAAKLRERLISERLQGVARQNGNSLAKDDVAGGLATAQVIVVKRRKIVVNQRVGVQHFNGCTQVLHSGWQGAVAAQRARGLHGEHRAQALAAGKGAVTDGAMNGTGHGIGSGQQTLQSGVGGLNPGAKNFGDIDRGGHCRLK